LPGKVRLQEALIAWLFNAIFHQDTPGIVDYPRAFALAFPAELS
jgi:uncharacterized membrane protein YhdT